MSLGWKLIGIIMNEVVPNRPKSVIVDFRLNDGGNFGNGILFAQALPKLLRPGGKVFVLVSASTFSAAIVTAAMLKESGGASVIFLGTGMGDNQQFWAEGSRVSLPNSKLRIKPCAGFRIGAVHVPISTDASGPMWYGDPRAASHCSRILKSTPPLPSILRAATLSWTRRSHCAR